jgi:hypothetical protein
MTHRDHLIERLQFALDHRYAHGVVIISVGTAKALLELLRPDDGARIGQVKQRLTP